MLLSRFAEYRKDDPQSFILHSNLQYFPQFMFNLRRSQFVQVFGVAPDETASHRMVLFKMPVLDALVGAAGHQGSQPSAALLAVSLFYRCLGSPSRDAYLMPAALPRVRYV